MKYNPIYLGLIYIFNHKINDLYISLYNYNLCNNEKYTYKIVHNKQKIYNFKFNPSLKTQEKYLSNLNK